MHKINSSSYYKTNLVSRSNFFKQYLSVFLSIVRSIFCFEVAFDMERQPGGQFSGKFVLFVNDVLLKCVSLLDNMIYDICCFVIVIMLLMFILLLSLLSLL